MLAAVEKANEPLAELGIEPIRRVGFHSLRRTRISLGVASGQDVYSEWKYVNLIADPALT